MPCPRCREFYRKYPLTEDPETKELEHVVRKDDGEVLYVTGPIQCAFTEQGTFTSDNWCCETLYPIRQLFTEDILALIPKHHEVDDSLGVLVIPRDQEVSCVQPAGPQELQQGFLVLSWYKSRGRTGQAVVMLDSHPPQPLNLRTAEYLIEKIPEIREEALRNSRPF